MTRTFCSLVSVLAVIAMTSTARAEDPKQAAAKAIARAKEHHKAGKLTEALQELTIAYALDPQKDLLYGIAQLHVRLGHCPEAITFYQKYLAAKPDADSASKAQQAIIACYEKRTPVVEPPKPPQPEPPKPEPPKPEPPKPPKPALHHTSPWYADVLGDVLVGSGVTLAAIGLAEYVQARSAFAEASEAGTYTARVDGYDDARGKRTIAVVAGASGVALGIAGVIRYATRGSAVDAVAVTPASGGGLVTWMARW